MVSEPPEFTLVSELVSSAQTLLVSVQNGLGPAARLVTDIGVGLAARWWPEGKKKRPGYEPLTLRLSFLTL